MKPNQIDEGRLSDRGEGLGTVTAKMVRQRARQIAMINGRSEKNVLDSDIQQALRELHGEDEINPPLSPEESIPEDKRWDPIPASEGHETTTIAAPDEQSYVEKIYDEGVADAELDQEIEAEREERRRERKGE